MQGVLAHLQYTLRLLLKSPGFTLTAVLILSLGIGANTAIFSLIDNVLLKPLAYPHPERLVQLFEPFRDLQHVRLSYPDYLDSRQGLIVVGIGLATGLAAALALSQFIASILYGVSAIDVVSIGLSVPVLGLAALIACLLPALRSTRINPITPLRE